MQDEMSIMHLVLEASLLVQLVMLILALASIASWALIFQKRAQLRRAQADAEDFEDRFWSGGNLAEIYARIGGSEDNQSGMERIFRAGFREFSRMRKQGSPVAAQVEAAQRAMRITLSREEDDLESRIPFLATVGSVSPYIGLFGTVWGIMNSFRALGAQQQATLATVAPGIAEALIATALGLFAAIPAVIGYNRYANQVERMCGRYDTFMEEFVSILQRHAHSTASAGSATGDR
ncbi:biopolymer transport protein TolQ [Natronocella acetinitrilica]|uniref:Tol-Pal system protein TolQ n=1 Tax=Natronocella acetinitrilica TaxID=414046 RepID=A0AAE3KAW7_9GAMM|nr:protein TolQ [Natronocella acetinitrilica]MCP1674089.1 biopolymer transport protein TolQ [Natronocella acetinitrilica]